MKLRGGKTTIVDDEGWEKLRSSLKKGSQSGSTFKVKNESKKVKVVKHKRVNLVKDVKSLDSKRLKRISNKEGPEDDPPVVAVVAELDPVLSPKPSGSLALVPVAPISSDASYSQLRRPTCSMIVTPAPPRTSLAMVPYICQSTEVIERQIEHTTCTTKDSVPLQQEPGPSSRLIPVKKKQERGAAAGTLKKMVKLKKEEGTEEPEEPPTTKLAVSQKRKASTKNKLKTKREPAICEAVFDPNPSGGIPDQTVLPRSRFNPYSTEYFREIVDNWEYTGLRTQGNLWEPAIQKSVKDHFWHYLQFEAGRALCVMVEQLPQPEDTPEGSTFLIFKVCTIDAKQGKLFHEVAATTKLLYPRQSRSSYYFHIVDEAVAKKINVTLKAMMRAWEKAYGVTLSRRIHFTDGWKNDKERDEMMLRLSIEVGLIPDPNAPAPGSPGSPAVAQQEQRLQLNTQQRSEEVEVTPE